MYEYDVKIRQLEDRLSAAEEELRALKARDNKDDLPEPPHPRPKLNCCNMCYHIDSTGTVLGGLWDNTTWDYQRLAIGNVFLTEEAADFAAERVKVLAEMREWAGKWNDEFALRYDEETGIEPYIHVFPCKSYGEMRFATKEDAEGCIKAVGKERLLRYYFMVPEEDDDGID